MKITTHRPVEYMVIDRENGKKPIRATFLGRGLFAKAYRANNAVYIVVKDCPMKEAVSQWVPRMRHIPVIEDVGAIETADDYKKVYRMPFYSRVTKKQHPEAFRQAKELGAALERATQLVSRTNHNFQMKYFAYEIMQATIAEAEGKVPASLIRALQALCDAGRNYGDSIGFEFPLFNLGVDSRGTLILRDVLFDAKLLYRAATRNL